MSKELLLPDRCPICNAIVVERTIKPFLEYMSMPKTTHNYLCGAVLEHTGFDSTHIYVTSGCRAALQEWADTENRK